MRRKQENMMNERKRSFNKGLGIDWNDEQVRGLDLE
jgi:hypothetical protein